MKLLWPLLFGTLTLVAQVPKTWDDQALKDWATPIAGLGVRPGHFSEKEYYSTPVDNYRTYPVYAAGRAPQGYFDKIKATRPQRLIEAEKLKSKADWIAAGASAWEQWDFPAFRNYDPALIEEFRLASSPRLRRFKPRADGTLPGARWVVTNKGLAVGVENCTMCHRRYSNDGSIVDGPGMAELGAFSMPPIVAPIPGMATIELPGDDEATGLWRSFAVPWLPNDIHQSLLKMTEPAVNQRFGSSVGPALSPRWNGSIFYPTKIPDLIALKGQKYIDHTGTHRYRGTTDLMRYAALVTYADRSDFGPHQMLSDAQRKIPVHAPDELLYAMALYIESLQAPPNPNPVNAQSEAGKKVFAQQGCSGCHSGPNYTSGKLTLANGFTPSKDLLTQYDIMPISVGTDPAAALKTRKGTGFYKIPSLLGLWYRGRYLHDGAVMTLEEMFNPERLNPNFTPSGFKGLDKNRAVPGHEFGLKLSLEDRQALIAFLKTL